VYRVVPEATYKRRSRLTVVESERTERLARVIATAESVWGDADDAKTWLNTAHPELDGQMPLEAAFFELGARRVEELLARLEYGLPV
jgi:putative toxin-antitoxin system antitoxin component (TIGR02293 family)